MALSTETSFQKSSYQANRLVIVVILLSCLVFNEFVGTHCRKSWKKHSPKGNFVETVDGSRYRFLSSSTKCLRPCIEYEKPRTCYYHFTLELYPVLGGACELCTPNCTNAISSNCQCITADGVERIILSANRMLPGPSIQVCKGDKVIIDVTNQLHHMEVTIHWHGIFQNGSQYYDGVPYITQCPISYGNTFRYQWLADNPGTHFWHSHAGLQKLDGLHGSLIVREPLQHDPNSKRYDYDLPEHVIVLSDWMHEQATARYPGLLTKRGQIPVSALINGKGQYTNRTTGKTTQTPLEVFTIKSGRKYRFRLINALCTVCPAQLDIEKHKMTLIGTDGESVRPVRVDTILSYAGERYDFVISGNRPPGLYWIQFRCLGECSEDQVQQLAILRYEGKPHHSTSKPPSYDPGLPLGVILNPLDGKCDKKRLDAVCINQLKNNGDLDEAILTDTPDVKVYLPFRFQRLEPSTIYHPNTYQRFLVPPNGNELISLIHNISFAAPPSPPLSQIADISPTQFCNRNNETGDCAETCKCTHRIQIPMHALVECILVDEVGQPSLSHPFHLHGYVFKVMNMGRLHENTTTKITADYVRNLDNRGLIKRRFDKPPSKDTIAVPDNGYVIFRFRAHNPGYWLMHCHFQYHIVVGMEVLFQVGKHEHLPPVPRNFPKCGNYLPPITPIEY